VFEPARRLHQAFGFEYCPRFGEYLEDPDSVFMMHRPQQATNPDARILCRNGQHSAAEEDS